MSIESLLIAAQYLESQEGLEDQDFGIHGNFNFHNSPSRSPPSPCTSSSNESTSRKSPSKGQSPNQKSSGIRRSESNRSVNREVHNRLEKNRRAQMKEGFERLKRLVPNIRSPKISSLALLKEVTVYINNLKSENDTYEEQLKNLETKRMDLLNERKVLRTHMKLCKKKKTVKRDHDNESTSTASGEKSDVVPERRRESYILYSHLTSEMPSISATSAPANPAVLPSRKAKDLDMPFSSDFSCEAAAESLLKLNHFQDSFKDKNICDNGERAFPERNNQVALPSRTLLNTKNKEPEAKKDEKVKPARKKKLQACDGKTSVIQEPKNKLLSEFLLAQEPVANLHVNSDPKAKNGKEAVLLQDDKAKYIVAFRPLALKNNVAYASRSPSDNQQSIPKVLMNGAAVGRHASEQYLLINGSQGNASSLDCKPQLMVFENELKFINCKSVAKEESASNICNLNSNNVVDGKGGSGFYEPIAGMSVEGTLVQERSCASKTGDKTSCSTPVLNGSIVSSTCEKSSQDTRLQVPSTVIPSFGLVLSSVNTNSNQQFTETQMSSTVLHNSQQDTILSGQIQKAFQGLQHMNNSVIDNNCLLKSNPQNFGLRCNDSKLYLIAVPNSNKTIHINGANI